MPNRIQNNLKTLISGHEYEILEEERLKKLLPHYDGFIKLKEGNWFYPLSFPQVFERVYEMECRPTDTFVASLPKSGTNWTIEIIWTLIHNPDLKNPNSERSLECRCPQLEMDTVFRNAKIPNLTDDSEVVKFMKSKAPEKVDDNFLFCSFPNILDDPRVMRTHLPLPLFPKNGIETSKIVYVARDPRDMIASKFQFFRTITAFDFQGTLDDFVDGYLNEEQFHQPHWQHVKSYYDVRDYPNVLFIYYEDLKQNLVEEISKISEFLGLTRTTQQIQNVADYTNFINMKKRSEDGVVDHPCSDGGRYINPKAEEKTFFRNGKIGSWKNSFSEEQIEKIDAWMKKNLEMFPDDFKYKQKK